MQLSVVVAILVCAVGLRAAEIDSYIPEQVHISYGESPSIMVVTWNTPGKVVGPVVNFGLDKTNLTRFTKGFGRLFIDGGFDRRQQWIYRAYLTTLLPNKRYYYRVAIGSSTDGPWGQMFSFVSMNTNSDFAPSLAIYGDLGLINAQSVPRLTADVEKNMYDAIIHIGDFAYDMATDNSRVGDAFMRLMEPIAANVPYMTCPGNHEFLYNFTNYRARFSMPGKSQSIFYSFDMGPVHFVGISTEVYFFVYYGISQIRTQYQWLENDLKIANHPSNRAKRPWIILFGHRPMYCSNGGIHCDLLSMIVRDGYLGQYGLESLLQRYGVDLTFWGHEHSYERMWPILNGVVRNGTIPGKPYVNPMGPVHIVTGSAGCRERITKFKEPQPFSAFRAADYGYLRMKVLNKTHIYMEQVSDDQKGKVLDSMTLIREQHTPFGG